MQHLKINWVNDHTQICDRLNQRVQRMQDYLDSKSDNLTATTTRQSPSLHLVSTRIIEQCIQPILV